MPQKMTAAARRVIEEVRRLPSTRVKVAVTDIDGVLRGKYLHKDKFLSAAESGFGFCSVVFGWDANDQPYDNTVWTGWQTGFPDATVQLDLATFRRVPWDGGVPFFLGDFVEPDGTPGAVCPRQVYKRVLARGAKLGFECSRPGVRWFNFRETPQSIGAKHYVRRRRSRRHVRLLADARRAEPALFPGASGGTEQFAFDRRPAHETARRLRSRDPVRRGHRVGATAACCSSSRPRDRPALRHHAEFHGEWSTQYRLQRHIHQSLTDASATCLRLAPPLPHVEDFRSYLAGSWRCWRISSACSRRR